MNSKFTYRTCQSQGSETMRGYLVCQELEQQFVQDAINELIIPLSNMSKIEAR